MKKKFVIVFNIFFLLLPVSCKYSKKDFQAAITLAVGTVKINNAPITIGAPLKESDTLVTGEESFAVVQFSESALLVIKSNTSLKIDSLVRDAFKDSISLKQNYGTTLNKIIKGKSDYVIRGETMSASVRGTEFLLQYDRTSDTFIVKVLQGTVSCKNIMERKELVEEKTVQANYKIRAVKGAFESPVELDRKEEEELAVIDQVNFLKKKADSPKLEVPLEQKNEVMDEETKTKILEERKKGAINIEKNENIIYEQKLMEIKEKNRGKLDKISLKNGKVMLGMIIERGLSYKIVTPRGTVTIPKSDIVSQTIIY